MVWKRSLWATWVPETSGGPTPTWGWLQTQRVGFLEYSISTDECWPPDPWTQPIGTMTTYHSYRYTDEAGTRHPFFISFTEFDPPSYEEYCGSGFEERAGYAIDNSGIYLDLTSGSEELTAKDGTDLTVSSMKDSNGNYVSMVVVSANERHWKDTTGRVAVKVIKRTSCEGGFPECTDYVHKSADGTDQTATLYYSSFNVKTAFNCSGVGEYNQTGKLLPVRLKLANGQSYDFAYEPTPGDPTRTTARLPERYSANWRHRRVRPFRRQLCRWLANESDQNLENRDDPRRHVAVCQEPNQRHHMADQGHPSHAPL